MEEEKQNCEYEKCEKIKLGRRRLRFMRNWLKISLKKEKFCNFLDNLEKFLSGNLKSSFKNSNITWPLNFSDLRILSRGKQLFHLPFGNSPLIVKLIPHDVSVELNFVSFSLNSMIFSMESCHPYLFHWIANFLHFLRHIFAHFPLWIIFNVEFSFLESFDFLNKFLEVV